MAGTGGWGLGTGFLPASSLQPLLHRKVLEMKILVVGGGGREHSLVWKIAQSPHEEVIAAADEHGMAMVFTSMRHFRH